MAGVSALLAGLRRYYRALEQIDPARFDPARPSVIAVTAVLIVIAALAAVFIFALHG